MGVRFRRSIRIAPGVKVNLTKTGVGLTVGPRGAHYSVHSSGRRTKTVGLPGTGIYYQETEGPSAAHHAHGASRAQQPGAAPVAPTTSKARGCSPRGCAVLVVGFIILGAIGSALGVGTPHASSSPSFAPTQNALAEGAQSTSTPTGGVSISAPAPSPTPPAASSKPTPATKPKATPKPTVRPNPTVKPLQLAVRVVAAPGTVSPGSYASVSVRTSAGASCSIEVDYASGPSKASGLVNQTAPSSGLVTWTWKVGTRTSAGSWPVYITCQRGSSSASAQTVVQVT